MLPPTKTTPEQKAILEEFRTRISDLLDEFELRHDEVLLNYLIEKKFKIDKAEKLFRKAWAFRAEQNGLVKDFKAPEVLECRKYLPYGLAGVDKEGDYVFIARTGCADHKGIWKSAGKDNLFKFGVQEGERLFALYKALAIKDGRKTFKASAIIDMEDFPVAAITKPKYISFAWEIFNMGKKFVPSNTVPFVKAVYVINNKSSYKSAIELAKSLCQSFGPPGVFDLAQIYGENRDEWIKALLKDIPADQLPKHWGGTKAGIDEYCSDIICPGGKVPESMYIKKKK